MVGVGRSWLFYFRFVLISLFFCFFVKQKTAYEVRISDWSSDVCSSDLLADAAEQLEWVWPGHRPLRGRRHLHDHRHGMAASQAQVACGYVERVTMLPRQLEHPRTRIRVEQRTVGHRPRQGDLGHPGPTSKDGSAGVRERRRRDEW